MTRERFMPECANVQVGAFEGLIALDTASMPAPNWYRIPWPAGKGTK